MDARTDTAHVPLCVDLDGTLIATDSLWEGLAVLILRRPWLIFHAVAWAIAGKQVLKREVAARCAREGGDWPYRAEVVELIKTARAERRKVWLVTGAAEKTAHDVAAHLGLFDRVLHSTDTVNLTSHRKRDMLVAELGEGGFDYAGNSRDDIEIFDAARKVVVVAPDRAALAWSRNHDGETIAAGPPSQLSAFKAIRIHQWLKNVLIAVPVVLNHEYGSVGLIVAATAAFFSFSFFASAVYIVNDIVDLGNDRRHARKKMRPIASGAVSIPIAAALALSLLAASLSLASLLPPLYWLALAIYGFVTTAYTFVLKRKLLVDVFTLAGLYTMRIIAGSAATGTEFSFWLLAFSIFFFLSLALVKRYVELADMVDDESGKLRGRSYMKRDLDMVGQAGIASAFASALVLALYIDSKQIVEMYDTPWLLWPLCPLILYMLLRIWILASRSMMHEDPVVFIMRDWRSQIITLVGAGLMLAAV